MAHSDLRIDTHSFLGEHSVLSDGKDTSGYFELPQFANTRFFPILIGENQTDEVIDHIRDNPRFLGCSLIFSPNPNIPYSPNDDIAVMKRTIQNPNVLGLKFHPPLVDTPLNDPSVFPFYEVASETGLPLLVHCSASGTKYNSAEMTEEVCSRFPELRLVLAHFGGNNLEYMARAVDITEHFPNLHINTTAIDPHRKKFRVDAQGDRQRVEVKETREQVLDIFSDAFRRIPLKILFGSDLGFYKPEGIDEDPTAQYLTWPVDALPSEDQQRVFVENSLNLYSRIKALE
ncbi:MAG: amidohydrolase family protein [Nanoarchaeota archaeon]|nr:amidohydrolase family protein [Nanoarchaeota archaeon]